MASWTKQVDRFCYQYLQLEADLDYPEPALLKTATVQDALYDRLFADGAKRYAPPLRYQLRVLKELMAKIEGSIDDWDEYVSQKILHGQLSDHGRESRMTLCRLFRYFL